MTAAQAVASRVGAPLGHDYAVVSLSDRLKPWDIIAKRIGAPRRRRSGPGDLHPASKTRTWQVGAMRDILLGAPKPDTPVVIGRDVAGPERIGAGGHAGRTGSRRGGRMRCLLIIGSSQTVRHGDTVSPPDVPARLSTRAPGQTRRRCGHMQIRGAEMHMAARSASGKSL